jgi:hypothetical protein
MKRKIAILATLITFISLSSLYAQTEAENKDLTDITVGVNRNDVTASINGKVFQAIPINYQKISIAQGAGTTIGDGSVMVRYLGRENDEYVLEANNENNAFCGTQKIYLPSDDLYVCMDKNYIFKLDEDQSNEKMIVFSLSLSDSKEAQGGGESLTNDSGKFKVVSIAQGQNVVDCQEDMNCFSEKFKQCQQAKISTAAMGMVYNYEISGLNKDGACLITTKYFKCPNPAWDNKEMTCIYDTTKDFQAAASEVMTNIFTHCEGPLKKAMIGEE